MTRSLCAAPSCRAEQGARQVSAGFRFCARCRQKLATDLAELPALYEACERALEYGTENLAGRVRGWWPSGIRLNESALQARAAMTGVLASWCQLILEERGSPRRGAIAAPRQRDIAHMAAFLSTNLGWLTAHAAATDFITEINDVTAVARRVVRAGQRVRVELGPCPEPGCGDTVFAVKTIGEPQDHQVTCGAGHICGPREWLMLGRQIERARPA
jgi:hypothetical protein